MSTGWPDRSPTLGHPPTWGPTCWPSPSTQVKLVPIFFHLQGCHGEPGISPSWWNQDQPSTFLLLHIIVFLTPWSCSLSHFILSIWSRFRYIFITIHWYSIQLKYCICEYTDTFILYILWYISHYINIHYSYPHCWFSISECLNKCFLFFVELAYVCVCVSEWDQI